MNKEKYARMCVVLDSDTDKALRHIASVTDQGVSAVVRELLSEPVKVISETLRQVQGAKTPEDRQSVLDQVEMFVEGAYGEYLQQRDGSHG